MCDNTFDDRVLLDPKTVKWRKTAWCYFHEKECPIGMPAKDDADSMGVLGAPCQLFSTNLGFNQVVNCTWNIFGTF